MVDTSAILVKKIKNQQNKINFLKASKDYSSPTKLVIDKSVFENAVNKVIFCPSRVNLIIYQKYNSPVSKLIKEWWPKINTSKNITKYSSDIDLYRNNLKSGDITLLGLVTDGGVGLQTGNNGRCIGVPSATKEAIRTKDARISKLTEFILEKKLTEFGVTKESIQIKISKMSEKELRKLFDTFKEMYGRDIFGQGFLYRIISSDEIKNVREMTEDEQQN